MKSSDMKNAALFQQDAHALNYELPDARIARYPLPERDAAKLLIWRNGHIADSTFCELAGQLPDDSLLVFNNTRVIHARLRFRKATGAAIELFCLTPVEPSDYQIAFQQTDRCIWECMVGNLKKWKDELLETETVFDGMTLRLTARKLSTDGGNVNVEFCWTPEIAFGEALDQLGSLPVPPYLERAAEASDETDYQTVYSSVDGSVAAPTAGLHFTEATFGDLHSRGIDTAEVTLHVGAGTFKPVKAATIAAHEMHTEHFAVSRHLLQTLAANTRPLIAVGTTSVRTLESLYWLGVKMAAGNAQLTVGQWEPYQHSPQLTVAESLSAILEYMDSRNMEQLQAATQIFIVPGYRFRLLNGMITNFHQPQSTLLLLVAAFIGDDWRRTYQHALDNGYRFLSYGDGNLYVKEC